MASNESVRIFTGTLTERRKLLSMVPKPVRAVVLLFPITDASEEKRKEEDAATEAGKLPPVDPTVIWIKQTVSMRRIDDMASAQLPCR